MATAPAMTQGSIWKILVRFSLPLFLGNLFQQLYNVADSFVVGNFCGDAALAAVSSSGSLCYLLIGFFQGVFVGASVLISHRYGAQNKSGVEKAVHTAVIFSLVIGLTLTVLGVCFTPTILHWMGTPDSVMPDSVLYFRIYCAGLLGLVLYNAANGIFQALGDSNRPLRYLVISSLTNVVLDLIFVVLLDLDVAGAALATILSQGLSALLAFRYLMSGKFLVQIRPCLLHVDLPTLRPLLRLGLPSGVQNSLIALANLVVQTNINAFGDNAMAGCGSYSKLEGFVFLPIVSLTLALTTFVGQNLGAGQTKRCKQGARTGIIMAVVLAELFGILFWFFAPELVALFSDSPGVVAFGVRQARTEALFYFLLAFAHAAASVLRGAGKTVTPMLILLGCWCLLRITYITLMVRVIPDITVVFTAYPLTWGISCLFFGYFLKRGDWLHQEKNTVL